MSRFKLLVAGSRDVTDYQTVYSVLDQVYLKHYPMILIHGAAQGADAIADTWGMFRPSVHVARVPADWENDGRSAGPLRNEAMLHLQPDLMVAFKKIDGKNIGTNHMIRLAREAGIPVEVYEVE